MYLIEELKASLAKALSKAMGEDIAIDALEYPELSENGDLAFPCFSLAKKLKSAPPKIAADLAAEVKLPDGFERVEAKGPYLNFFLDRTELVEQTTSAVLK